MKSITVISLASLVGTLPFVAFAGGPLVAGEEPALAAPATVSPANGLSFTLLGGVSVAPEYFGSKNYTAGPDIGLSDVRFRWGSVDVGAADPSQPKLGFDVHGALRYIAKRDASEHTELTGLNDVKAAVELGLGVGYTGEYFRTFADVRYGAIGHKGVAGEAGADLIWRTGDLTLTAGPRVQFGNAKFANTYFGVTAAESAASGLAAYTAGGGIYGAGLEIGATYKLSEDWGLSGAATWSRMQGDAKNSPIVTQGDKDQFGLRVGLTRRVTFGF